MVGVAVGADVHVGGAVGNNDGALGIALTVGGMVGERVDGGSVCIRLAGAAVG